MAASPRRPTVRSRQAASATSRTTATRRPADVDKAKALIAEYEAEKGELPTFKFGTTNDPFNVETNQLVQAQWAGVRHQNRHPPDRADAVHHGGRQRHEPVRDLRLAQPRLLRHRWQLLLLDSALAPPPGEFAINFGRMIDPDIDAILATERESLDPAERQKASQDLNRIMGSKAENDLGQLGHLGEHRQAQRPRPR